MLLRCQQHHDSFMNCGLVRTSIMVCYICEIMIVLCLEVRCVNLYIYFALAAAPFIALGSNVALAATSLYVHAPTLGPYILMDLRWHQTHDSCMHRRFAHIYIYSMTLIWQRTHNMLMHNMWSSSKDTRSLGGTVLTCEHVGLGADYCCFASPTSDGHAPHGT